MLGVMCQEAACDVPGELRPDTRLESRGWAHDIFRGRALLPQSTGLMKVTAGN